MGTILAFVLTLLALNVALKAFRAIALKHVEYSRTFSADRMYAGDVVTMTTTICNHKFLPLPWLRMCADYPVLLDIVDQKMSSTNQSLRHKHISVTSLFSFQKVIRKNQVTCVKRGYYTFCDVQLTTGDFLGLVQTDVRLYDPCALIVYPKVRPLDQVFADTKVPQGQRSIRRWILPDPIEKVGIREYTGQEPFHSIDWKASARSNRLMVAQFDFKSDPSIMLLLNTAHFQAEWLFKCPDCFEDIISAAASLSEAAMKEGIPVGMGTTAAIQSSKSGNIILPESSMGQRRLLLETMARMSEYNCMNAQQLIRLYMQYYEPQHTIFFFTEVMNQQLASSLNRLHKEGYALHVVLLERSKFQYGLSDEIPVHYARTFKGKERTQHVQMA